MRPSIVLALLCLAPLPMFACSGSHSNAQVDLTDGGADAASDAGGGGLGTVEDSGARDTLDPPVADSGSKAADAATPAPMPEGGPTSEGGTKSEAGAATGDGGTPASVLSHCLSTLNSYRNQSGIAALTNSSALEGYAASAAASDSASGVTHGYFSSNNGGSGVSAAESEISGWPLDQYTSADDLIDQGIAAIVNEGPGAVPYDNLLNGSFTLGGCGMVQTSDGLAWVTFEYK